MTPDTRYILLDDQIRQTVRFYDRPLAVLKAETVEAIYPVFEKLSAYHQQGYYLAGYCAYELGYALEPKLGPLMPKDRQTPLLMFGVFERPQNDMPLSMRYTTQRPKLSLETIWSEAQYLERFDRVIRYIKAGDIYQVNLTFPVTGTYDGEAHSLYAHLRRRQPGHYGGIVKLEGPDIITFSPELFFKKEGDTLSMRPMKGTRPRSGIEAQDAQLITDMQAEPKSRAENLMIVDLLRNDLSRISIPGSVTVPELFSVETYPTLHQMISKINSSLIPNTSFRDIFKSLFPCGSVTGAPKIRAMEIIRELEISPRNAYCGAVGYIDPDGSACFNVGIRTLTLAQGTLSYSIGSGIVLDSDGPDEYKECLLKADILTPPPPVLIETFLWQADEGFKNLDLHLARLKKSARLLKYRFNNRKIRQQLGKAVKSKKTDQRVRLTVSQSVDKSEDNYGDKHGDNYEDKFCAISVTVQDFEPFKTPLSLALSKHVLSNSVQNYDHKISARDFYDGERERLKTLYGVDEVLFTNAEGYLCEGSFTTVFIKRDGHLYTPPLTCGLLPGILRQALISENTVTERAFKPEDILETDEIFLGNSMRGLMRAKFFKNNAMRL